MEFSQTVSSLSCSAKGGQPTLLQLSHDCLAGHLVNLLLLFALYAMLLHLSFTY